jgi:hypothetical protein
MNINKLTLTAFRKDFTSAVAGLEEKYGVKVVLGNISYSDTEFHGKLTVSNPRSAKEVDTLEETNYRMYAPMFYDLPENTFGKEVVFNTKRLKIVGINTRCTKSPIKLEEVLTGKKYKASADSVKNMLKRQEELK